MTTTNIPEYFSLLPSEVCRIVLGYLLTKQSYNAAACLLAESQELMELRAQYKSIQDLPLKLSQVTFLDLIQDYMRIANLVAHYQCKATASVSCFLGSLSPTLSSILNKQKPGQPHVVRQSWVPVGKSHLPPRIGPSPTITHVPLVAVRPHAVSILSHLSTPPPFSSILSRTIPVKPKICEESGGLNVTSLGSFTEHSPPSVKFSPDPSKQPVVRVIRTSTVSSASLTRSVNNNSCPSTTQNSLLMLCASPPLTTVKLKRSKAPLLSPTQNQNDRRLSTVNCPSSAADDLPSTSIDNQVLTPGDDDPSLTPIDDTYPIPPDDPLSCCIENPPQPLPTMESSVNDPPMENITTCSPTLSKNNSKSEMIADKHHLSCVGDPPKSPHTVTPSSLRPNPVSSSEATSPGPISKSPESDISKSVFDIFKHLPPPSESLSTAPPDPQLQSSDVHQDDLQTTNTLTAFSSNSKKRHRNPPRHIPESVYQIDEADGQSHMKPSLFLNSSNPDDLDVDFGHIVSILLSDPDRLASQINLKIHNRVDLQPSASMTTDKPLSGSYLEPVQSDPGITATDSTVISSSAAHSRSSPLSNPSFEQSPDFGMVCDELDRCIDELLCGLETPQFLVDSDPSENPQDVPADMSQFIESFQQSLPNIASEPDDDGEITLAASTADTDQPVLDINGTIDGNLTMSGNGMISSETAVGDDIQTTIITTKSITSVSLIESHSATVILDQDPHVSLHPAETYQCTPDPDYVVDLIPPSPASTPSTDPCSAPSSILSTLSSSELEQTTNLQSHLTSPLCLSDLSRTPLFPLSPHHASETPPKRRRVSSGQIVMNRRMRHGSSGLHTPDSKSSLRSSMLHVGGEQHSLLSVVGSVHQDLFPVNESSTWQTNFYPTNSTAMEDTISCSSLKYLEPSSTTSVGIEMHRTTEINNNSTNTAPIVPVSSKLTTLPITNPRTWFDERMNQLQSCSLSQPMTVLPPVNTILPRISDPFGFSVPSTAMDVRGVFSQACPGSDWYDNSVSTANPLVSGDPFSHHLQPIHPQTILFCPPPPASSATMPLQIIHLNNNNNNIASASPPSSHRFGNPTQTLAQPILLRLPFNPTDGGMTTETRNITSVACPVWVPQSVQQQSWPFPTHSTATAYYPMTKLSSNVDLDSPNPHCFRAGDTVGPATSAAAAVIRQPQDKENHTPLVVHQSGSRRKILDLSSLDVDQILSNSR